VDGGAPRALARYEDLVFSPLALPAPPKVDAKRLVSWMRWAREEGHKRGLNASERNYDGRTGRRYPWLMANVYYLDRSHVEDSFDEEFPRVAEYARGFPMKDVGGIVLLAQRGRTEVHLHTDSDGFWGFRFYLTSKDYEGLYFCMTRKRVSELPRTADDWSSLLEVECKHYARWPKGNRPFCLNCNRAAHAVDPSSCKLGERIACLVLPRNGLDEKKLLPLLEESTARYRDSQLWYQPGRAIGGRPRGAPA
jgi:hypothetical protein